MLMKYQCKNLKPLLSDQSDRISGLCSVLHSYNELVCGCCLREFLEMSQRIRMLQCDVCMRRRKRSFIADVSHSVASVLSKRRAHDLCVCVCVCNGCDYDTGHGTR